MALGALKTIWFPRLGFLLLLAAGTGQVGCVSGWPLVSEGEQASRFLSLGPRPPSAFSSVQQIHCTWANNIIFDADVVNGGQPHPGLRGRLYFFDKEMGHPIQAHGELFIDLYDLNQRGQDGKPKMLERWHFHQDALNQRLQKDLIGWGYNLFLPWATYRPDITHISLTASFVPPEGHPVYAPPVTLALQQERAAILSKGGKGQGVGDRSPELETRGQKSGHVGQESDQVPGIGFREAAAGEGARRAK